MNCIVIPASAQGISERKYQNCSRSVVNLQFSFIQERKFTFFPGWADALSLRTWNEMRKCLLMPTSKGWSQPQLGSSWAQLPGERFLLWLMREKHAHLRKNLITFACMFAAPCYNTKTFSFNTHFLSLSKLPLSLLCFEVRSYANDSFKL